MFPALEVMSSGPSAQQRPGDRLPVRDRFRFGRAQDAEVSLATGLISRYHCGIFFEPHEPTAGPAAAGEVKGAFWLRDLSSTNGTRLNGTLIHEAELSHGDVIEVTRGYCYQFLEHERDDVPNEAMENAIRSRPDVDGLWSVYSDWLQERGHPMGDQLSLEPGQQGPLVTLGALAADLSRGELQVKWRRGFPERLVLRSLPGNFGEWPIESRLMTLARTPGLRFVRHLEVDLGSFRQQRIDDEAPVRGIIESIGPALPMLQELVLKPASLFPTEHLSERFKIRLEDWAPASLELVALRPLCDVMAGSGKGLSELRLNEKVLITTPARVEVGGAALRAVSLTLTETGLWRLDKESAGPPGTLTVNGHDVRRCYLRNGDVIELVPGVRVIFRA